MFVPTTPKFVGFALTISFFLLLSFSALAQNEVAIGSATTKPNAILWLNGNGSQGLLLPVVTNKSAVSNPEKGMFVYDDSDSKVWYWNSSAWVEAGGSGAGGGTVTTVTGTSPVVVTNSNTTPEISLADGGITNAKLANDAITSAKIQDATITGSDISNTTISVDKLAQSGALSGQVLKWNGTNWVPQDDDAGVGSVPTLSNGQILIGNGTTNLAAVVSGDATLSGGVFTITNGVISGGTGGKITDASITDADIASAAAIDVTKLGIGANGQVLTTIAGVPTWSAGSAGTVTSVAAGTGLTGGPITSTGTLSVDVGTTANKIVQLDGTARLPAVDGSQLSGLNASNISAGLLPLNRITAGTVGEVLTTVAGVPSWQAPVTGVTTLDGLTDATVAAPASGQILVNDGAGQFRNVGMTGDAGISAAGALTIANGAVSGGVGGKISDGTIAAADLAAGSVSGGVGGIVTDGSITAADLAAGAVSGGVGGNLTDASVTNADISGSAAIAVSKVAAGADGNVLTTVLGVPTWQAPAASADAQDLTIAGTTLSLVNDPTPVVLGGLSILNTVTSAEITNATIAAVDLAPGSVNGGVAGVITDGSITTADIADGTIVTADIADGTVTNADISGVAAIAVTKVAAGADGNVLTTVLGVPTWQAPAASADAQDLTIAGTTLSLVNDPTPVVLGGLSILNAVTTAEITNATIAAVDLAPGSVNGGVAGVITDGSITTADISDGTVTNADISGGAAIDVTKVAAGANGNVLTTVLGVPTWQAPVAGADAQDLTIAGTTLSLVNDPTPVVLGGLSILNTVTTAEITNATIIAADLAAGSVNGGAAGVITDGSITTADIADGTIVTADIADGTVTNADISGGAAIAVTKVAAGANGNVLTTVLGVPTWQAPVAGADAQDLTIAGTTLSLVNDPTPVVLGGLSILNSVTSAEITNGTVAAVDLAPSSVSGGVGGVITDGTITTEDITDGTVVTADIADGTITNTDISGAAAIAVTKVAAGANGNVLTTVLGVPTWQAPVTGATTLDGLTDATVAGPASGQILVHNGAGQFVNVAMSGDATISNTGALTIANGAINGGVGGKITDASIVAADLAAGAVSGGAGGIITDGTITTDDITDGTIVTADIADGTVTNADISGVAAIAVTKVAAGTNGQVLTTVGTTPTWAAPAAGFSTVDRVPKGDGTTLVGSSIYDVGGLVGINTSGPIHNLEINGSLYQSAGNSFFNQSLDDLEGNMSIGSGGFPTAKLSVESNQTYGIRIQNTNLANWSARFDADVDMRNDLYVLDDIYIDDDLFIVDYLDVGGAAYVAGNLDVVGAVTKGSGTFKIDHPLDPQNKFLYHSFVESPDMMNVYNGNIVTDSQGEMTVTLPDYFEALNKDFRYQLTVMGTFAQAIVYRKVINNSFVIKTDKPNVEVSWQVTGIRKDPYAEKNRVVPEVAKTGDQIGNYLYPEAYGLPAKTRENGVRRQAKDPVKQKKD